MRVQHSCGYGKTTRAVQVAWETTSGECIIHHVTGLCQQWTIRRATTSFRTPCLGRGASSGSRSIRPATLQGASGSYVQECQACTRPVRVIVNHTKETLSLARLHVKTKEAKNTSNYNACFGVLLTCAGSCRFFAGSVIEGAAMLAVSL